MTFHPFGSLRVTAHEMMLPGKQALKRDGEIVWLGPLGAPIEDAAFDELILNPDDYERMKARLDEENRS